MKDPNFHSDVLLPLLTTSVRVPQLRGELVPRSLLIEKLDRALEFPLALICAPAGFGKTTLLSQWIATRQPGGDSRRVAWVSLESGCDARQFLIYLIAALEGLQSGTNQAIQALLDTSQPSVHTILRVLINEISTAADDSLLILDDYHHVDDPSIHGGLTFLINHLPSNLHVVIASRTQPPLPLARWRASNLLFELREDDLRFTSAEVAAFLNETNGLNLSPEDITALETRTEGWIAGLHLVALTMQNVDDLSKHTFIAAFTGSQRYIMDYLVEEVLQRQPENLESFLLRTSVLDRLSAPLCVAITKQTDAQAILEHLERSHLFIMPLDYERHWYRYHHLFKDVLYHKLQQTEPDFVVELHRRAAEWFLHAGHLDDAIRHACAAHAWDQAVAMLESVVSTAWNRGEIRKIITWLGRLPTEHLDARINLSLYYSRALLLGGQIDAAEQRLRASEKVLRSRLGDHATVEDRLQLGAICALRTTIAAVSGEAASALELGREALDLLPADNLDLRAHVMNSLGINSYYLGNMVEAVGACAQAGKSAQVVGNVYLMMVAASYQAKALVCQGKLRQGGQVLEQALRVSEDSNLTTPSRVPAACVACAAFGNLLYEWNRLEEAESYLTEAIELGQQLAFGAALWLAYHTLARIKLVHGDRKGAEILLEQAQRFRLTYSVPIPSRLLDADKARADLALGQLEAVQLWARTYQADLGSSLGFVHESEGITRARLYIVQNQPVQALTLLNRLQKITESSPRKGHLIEILALTALAQHAQGEARLAVSTLLTALHLAEPEGYVRIFIDEGPRMAALLQQALAAGVLTEYISRLLALVSADDSLSGTSMGNNTATRARVTNDSLIEPLSQRELEVLQLIANGASNQDIAQALIISLTTAKKHVSNIIQKLGVENRTQAAAKGRYLQLCE